MNDDLKLAKAHLDSGQMVMVLVKGGHVIREGHRPGVADLLSFCEELGDAAQGAALADRVVGKAAALLVRAMGITSVYAATLSNAGRAALEAAEIPVAYGTLVPAVLNRRGDGPCPMEALVTDIDEPQAAYQALREFVRSRQSK